MRGRDGRVGAVSVISKEITELKQLEQRMRALSTRDKLTGLYNRRGFAGLADHRLKVAARQGSGVTLLFADLDNLKRINDTGGHLVGDAPSGTRLGFSLRRAGNRTSWPASAGTTLILLADAAAGARRGSSKGSGSWSAATTPAAGGAALSLSIGIGSCAAWRAADRQLIARADTAMYESKARRRAAPP